jgi:hypothetical protein
MRTFASFTNFCQSARFLTSLPDSEFESITVVLISP